MPLDSDFEPTAPADLPGAEAVPVNLQQLLREMEAAKSQPILALEITLQDLGLMNQPKLDALWAESPELLYSRSSELVERLLLSAEDLAHALARTAGIVDIDAAGFDLPSARPAGMTSDMQRKHELLYLGEADGIPYYASWEPASDKIRVFGSALAGRTAKIVWADRDAINKRLDESDPKAARQSPEAMRAASLKNARLAAASYGALPFDPDD